MTTVLATVRQLVNFVEVYQVDVAGAVTAESIEAAALDGWGEAIETVESKVLDEEVMSWQVSGADAP